MISFARKRAMKQTQVFIKNCTESDMPRLAAEVFPGDVHVDSDIVYTETPKKITYDLYTPYDVSGSKDCFVLIHGGAFVYGSKENDKNFGMHLARTAQIPVINVNYTLMPEADLSQQINEIFRAMNHAANKYGYTRFHTVGDSAGAYLAYIAALAARNRHVAHEVWVFEKLKGTVESAALICGAFKNNKKVWPAIYFEKEMPSKTEAHRLPEFVYDLAPAGVRDPGLKVCLITCDHDLPNCRRDTLELKKALEEAGIEVPFYDAKSETCDGFEMDCGHVFCIARPEWPMGVKSLQLIADNYCRR